MPWNWVKIFTSARAGHQTQLQAATCSWHCLILLKTYFEILLKYVETNDNLKCFLPQRELDIGLGCSWHVVVGEAFSFSFDFEKVLHCILTSSRSSKSRWEFCLDRCDSSDADFAHFFPDIFFAKGVPSPKRKIILPKKSCGNVESLPLWRFDPKKISPAMVCCIK